jgi:hypothetical protein
MRRRQKKNPANLKGGKFTSFQRLWPLANKNTIGRTSQVSEIS